MPGSGDAVAVAATDLDRLTVPALLDRRADERPDQILMHIGGEPITYAQMRERSCAAADVLLELGVDRGDGVSLFLGTRPEWVYFWLGCARIGAVVAAVNTANKADFLAHALRLARTRVVVTAQAQLDAVLAVVDQVPSIETIALVGGDSASTVIPMTPSVVRSVSPMLERASTSTPDVRPTAWDEVGALFYTSGTTGPSKAVATTWHYLLTAASAVATSWGFDEGETVWTAMPLFHLSAAPTVLAPMLVGGTTFVREAFRPTQVWDDIRDCGAVGFAGAGVMVSMLCALPEDPRDRDLPIRFISAAPIAAKDHDAIQRRYDCRIVTMYGLTEAFPIAVKSVTADGVPGTSGTINPAFEVEIRDPDRNAVPTGEVGEITCRAVGHHEMSEGYVVPGGADAGSAIAVAEHPSWYRTGDLGVFDDGGNLRYVDRLKDAMRRRGENVSSIEVEQVVLTSGLVTGAAAVGVPSALGEDDILIVVTAENADVDCVRLLDHCAQNMPYFAVPRYVRVADQLPTNVIGRIRKDLLRAEGITDDTWDREAAGYVVRR